MKKIGIVIFGIAVILGVLFSSLFSFGRLTGHVVNLSINRGVEGSGNLSAETRDVGEFDSVEVGGVFQVEIVAQKEFGVQVEADDNLLEHVKTEVRGGVLHVEADKRINSKSAINIRISAPNIERLEASGASKVAVSELKNSTFEVDSNGASKIILSGETARLAVNVSGASSIEALDLKANEATIDASGASSVGVSVNETLRAEASGASRITYAGNPQQLQKHVTGASSIKQK